MKLSIFKNRLIPSHFSEHHEKFVEFVGAYLDFLCSENSPFYTLDNLSSYTTISESIDTFYYQLLRDEYAVDFPKALIKETELFITNLIHIYRAKGTEAAYQYFFRIIYGVEVYFKYPKDSILKLSDGKWSQLTTLNFSGLDAEILRKIKSSYIKGMSTQSIGHVLNVVPVTPPQFDIYEFNLANISGNEFFIDESNSHYDEFLLANELNEDHFIIAKTYIDGKIYSIQNDSDFICEVFFENQPIEFEHVIILPGTKSWIQYDSEGYIKEVPEPELEIDPDELYVLQIEMIQGTFQFGESATIMSGDSEIVGTLFTIEDVSFSNGRWKNTDGLLNSDKLIQDNYFYQNYSYVIQTKIKPSLYFYSLKKLLHPAGLLLFTEYVQGAVDENDFVDLPEPIALFYHHLFLTILHWVDLLCKINVNRVQEIKRYIKTNFSLERNFQINELIKLRTPNTFVERKHQFESIREFVKNVIIDFDNPLQYIISSKAFGKKQTFLWDKFSELDDVVTSENYMGYKVSDVEYYNFESGTNLVFGNNKLRNEFFKSFNSPKEIGQYFNYKITTTKAIQEYSVIQNEDLTYELLTYDTEDGYTNLDNFIAFSKEGKYLKSIYFDVDEQSKVIKYEQSKVIKYTGPQTEKVYFHWFNHSLLHENWTFSNIVLTDDMKKIWINNSILFFDQDGNFISSNDLYVDKNDNILKSTRTYENVDVFIIPDKEIQKILVTDPLSYTPLEFENRDIQSLHYYETWIDFGKVSDLTIYSEDYGQTSEVATEFDDYGEV